MRLPEETVRLLQPLLPSLDLRRIHVRVTEPSRLATCLFCPLAYVKAGSSPYPGLIEIGPDYWDPESIDGLTLIAHELYHQLQMKDPEFFSQYEYWAEVTEQQGLPPWSHPLEMPAYEFESVVERYLSA